MTNLGPHGGFILAAYAFTGLMLAGLIAHAALDHRAQRRALAAFARREGAHEGAREGADAA